jgi:hypothetical protein
MKALFQVNVWQSTNGHYVADTVSAEDGKINRATATRLPVLMKTVSTRIAKRRQHNVKFPPVEKLIISPNGKDAPRLIISNN